jgi:hypothetical protein
MSLEDFDDVLGYVLMNSNIFSFVQLTLARSHYCSLFRQVFFIMRLCKKEKKNILNSFTIFHSHLMLGCSGYHKGSLRGGKKMCVDACMCVCRTEQSRQEQK